MTIGSDAGLRPVALRPQRAAAVVSIALAGFAAAAFVVAGRLPVGPHYVPKALALFALAAALVLRYAPAHHPFDRLGPANGATLARAAIVALLGEGEGARLAGFAAAAAGLAVALDFVDGRLARASGMASAFGARFDLETDAALVLVLAALAWQLHKAGAWVLLAGIARYAFVAAGAAAPWLRRTLPPSARRKAVAAVQMIALAVALAPPVAPPASALLAGAALATLLASFALDVAWLHRHKEVRP
jgi:phosphatidylglycerophosphate synthase